MILVLVFCQTAEYGRFHQDLGSGKTERRGHKIALGAGLVVDPGRCRSRIFHPRGGGGIRKKYLKL